MDRFYDFDNRVVQDETRLDVISCVKYLAIWYDAIIVFMSRRSEQPTRDWIVKCFDIKSVYEAFQRYL